MLNDRLSTAFILRDPDMDDVESDVSKEIPLALQRRLLLPFSQVKGLYSLSVSGFHKSIERELRTAMAIPAPTLSQSCESATKLLQEGDLALARADATEALRAYHAAFHAIHILIKGRTRRVLADTFFHANITTGIYAGQTGMTVRVILRLRLVARIISTYLAQRNWAEAAYWGMRSVRIMSEAMDTEFEDFLADLVGGDDVALVYIRAGIALLKMRAEAERFRDELAQYEGEDMADTTRLFSVSLKHLKRGTGAVKRELESYHVPRPLIVLFDESEERSEDGSETVNVDPTEHVGVGGVLGWF
ncbi:NADH dehydrogenase [ubiquinone] 1 alpha subcomplex assembly factor 3 [Neodidymelliopsis sp. IMI 364377]|nr:NADH dehydrogenase [ubiquinone] 1 alpha subcomplex assembly factor 3 [Neodidymelliopsis sp. IMI 364377]